MTIWSGNCEKGGKRVKNKRTAAIVMILLMSLFVICGCGSGEEEQTAQSASFRDLHSFSAGTLAGEEFTQDDFAEADVTVMNIWATWCGPCAGEMPEIAKYAADLPENVRLITYCIDGSEDPNGAAAFLSEAGYEGTTVIGGDGDLAALIDQIQYIPTTVFVDSSGNMVSEPIIGVPKDLDAAYTERINNALTELGKQELS